LLIEIARKRSIDPKNWLKFTHTFKSMYNDVNTYTERDIEWKNRMIAYSEMPIMITNELQIYFS
jgi:hypothetical protein